MLVKLLVELLNEERHKNAKLERDNARLQKGAAEASTWRTKFLDSRSQFVAMRMDNWRLRDEIHWVSEERDEFRQNFDGCVETVLEMFEQQQANESRIDELERDLQVKDNVIAMMKETDRCPECACRLWDT